MATASSLDFGDSLFTMFLISSSTLGSQALLPWQSLRKPLSLALTESGRFPANDTLQHISDR